MLSVYMPILLFLLAEAVDPLLDTGPVNIDKLRKGTTREIVSQLKNVAALLKMGKTSY